MKRLIVFSRHPSHNMLREAGLLFKKRTLIRLGSETIPKHKFDVEINSPESVKISANKLLMKRAFTKAEVNTANWFIYSTEGAGILEMKKFLTPNPQNKGEGEDLVEKDLPYPLIAKHIYGSRGTGNYKINDEIELKNWVSKPNRDLSKYIFEEFFKKGREYRLHVTKDGCFYTCRKLLRHDAEQKWHRHADNCVWILEDNPKFDKPVNWDAIVADCVKALNEIGADVLAFDVKVQLSKNKKGEIRENPEWILIESCSAPSFGDITLEKYIEEIPKIYKNKTQV